MKRFAALFMALALVFAVVPFAGVAFANGDTNTSAPSNGDTNTSAPSNGDTNTPAPSNGDTNTPAPGNGGTNTPAPGNGGTNTPAPGNGDTNTPAPGNEPETCKDLENASPEDIHEITLDHKESGNKIVVTATLPGVKEAEGIWNLTTGEMEAENPAVEETKEGVKGTSVTFEIDKAKLTKEGEYILVVVFHGKADGKECQWGVGVDGFAIEGDDVTPPAEEPKTPKTPDGKKNVIDQVKGGKLPKTATTYPTTAAAGAVVFLAGVALLAFRRTA